MHTKQGFEVQGLQLECAPVFYQGLAVSGFRGCRVSGFGGFGFQGKGFQGHRVWGFGGFKVSRVVGLWLTSNSALTLST